LVGACRLVPLRTTARAPARCRVAARKLFCLPAAHTSPARALRCLFAHACTARRCARLRTALYTAAVWRAACWHLGWVRRMAPTCLLPPTCARAAHNARTGALPTACCRATPRANALSTATSPLTALYNQQAPSPKTRSLLYHSVLSLLTHR